MLKFNYGFLCDIAHVGSDGKISILGMFDNINAKQFPATHPRMCIFVNWLGDEGTYKTTMRLIAPDGSEVIPVQKMEVRIPRSGNRTNMIAELNQIQLKSTGTYHFELCVEGQADKILIPLVVSQIQ